LGVLLAVAAPSLRAQYQGPPASAQDYMQAANYCIACHEPGHNLDVLELRYLSVRRAALRE
jgi:hypothetical protein